MRIIAFLTVGLVNKLRPLDLGVVPRLLAYSSRIDVIFI